MQFKDRVILVTGAASGIGLEISRQFMAAGATVIGSDVNAEALDEVASANPGSFHARVSDAGDPAAIADLAQWIEQEFGAIAKFSEDCTITVPGVRHNAVLPGFIDTPTLRPACGDEAVDRLVDYLQSSSPALRIGSCEDVANTVLFLASDAATYINGVQLLVDGGISKVSAVSSL